MFLNSKNCPIDSYFIAETDRCLLRTWSLSDAEALYHLTQDEGLNQFTISNYRIANLESAKNIISRIQEDFKTTGLGTWPVFDKFTGELMGICGLKNLETDKKSVEVMYRLASRFWGQGFATEAARGCIQYGFQKLKLKEIVAVVDPKNVRSEKVINKLNMEYVGHSDYKGASWKLYKLGNSKPTNAV